MATQNNQPTQAQLTQQNADARMMLLQSGMQMVKQLQPQTGALGSSIRIPLERMGIMTGIMLDVTVPVDVTVAATASPFGPYNLFNSISYTDYAGIQRVLTSGAQLHLLNCFRTRNLQNNSQKMFGYIPAETGIDTDILSLPTATGNALLQFSVYVPCAVDPASDLRGAVLSQTIYGDHYITVQLPPNLVATDGLAAPYTAGTVALQAGQQVSITAYQHYIMPQGGVSNLPMIDLSTIYAVEGNFNDSSNIVAGQPKYINYPNNRAILSALHIFDNGNAGVHNGADLNRIVLMANSNTNVKEMSPRYLRRSMRALLSADVASGVYYLESRVQPITTQLYGNVQTRFDIATVNAGAYFLSQYESVYMSGTPLPGVIQ